MPLQSRMSGRSYGLGLLADAFRIYFIIRNTWTPAKNASNLVKHDVAFAAADAFDWINALVTADVRLAYSEPRMVALGMIGDRLHVLVFTVERRSTHIISLRKANQKEFDRYAAS